MPTPTQPPRAFDHAVLTDVANSMKPNKGAQFALSIVFAAIMLILCSPLNGPLPALGILVTAIVACVVWWRYLRRGGVRGNDYSPMKTDVEAARTPFSWKEEGRLVLLLGLVFGLSQVASMVVGSGRWAYAGVAALITVGVAYWVISFDAWRPARYTTPEKLDRDIKIEKPVEWLHAFLYCRRCVPGGLQMLSDRLKEDLAHYGWTAKETDEALNKLVKQGNAVKIRELRSADGALNWVTLTEEGSQKFQQRYGG
ncbi:hypothetical protein ACN4DU_08230 [Corynebacterium macclintockiae]|uniref:hypothetical protein n=1 Tax=Corynebacterium macclintockiae TaxID=2913501 RepID=UPI003EB88B32